MKATLGRMRLAALAFAGDGAGAGVVLCGVMTQKTSRSRLLEASPAMIRLLPSSRSASARRSAFVGEWIPPSRYSTPSMVTGAK